MARTLVIATRSKGKFPEITSLLAGLPFECVSLNDAPGIEKEFEVEEPAMTFEGNALIKAMTIGRKTGLLTLADDSGLEVDVLGGQPGVKSARYAPGSDEDRYKKLLSELEAVPDEKRSARFRCVIALYDPATDKARTCAGACEGSIVRAPRGAGGFGYDPVFLCKALNKTLSEASLEEKNAVSHRGAALRLARKILEKEFIAP